MSLTTYGEMKTALATRLARSDRTAMIPDFLTIAHFNLMNGLQDSAGNWIVPPLRIRQMLTLAEELTPSDGEADLPADYLQGKKLIPDISGATPLKYKAPADFAGMGLASESGVPVFYTIEGLVVKIAPANGATLFLDYYARIDAPAVDADTNAIFTVCPHAYLFLGLAEAYAQGRAFEQSQYYLAQGAGVVRAANGSDPLGQLAGEPLQMMPGVTV